MKAALDSKPQAREQLERLLKPAPVPWLRDAFVDWAVMAGALVLAGWWDHPAGFILAVLVVGTRQHALSVLGHDGAHGAICRNRRMNDLLACVLCFWPIGVSMGGFRRFHFDHHRDVGTPEDPELLHRNASAAEWEVPFTRGRLARCLATDLLGFGIVDVLRIMWLTRPSSLRDALGPLLTGALVIGVPLLCGAWYIPVVWYGALVTSYWAVFRIRIFHEHVGAAETHRLDLPRWLGWLIAPHNVWYHWEHHRWPAVPYANLPQARELDRSVPVVPLAGHWRSLIQSNACSEQAADPADQVLQEAHP